MKKIKIESNYEQDVFYWVVNQRLVNYPNMPEKAQFGDMEDIKFGNAKEYIDLVKNLQYSYPDFDYNKEIVKLTKLID